MNADIDYQFVEAMMVDRKPDYVAFALDGNYEEHPFVHGRASFENGTRYHLIYVPLDDDDTPVTKAAREAFNKRAKKSARTTNLDKIVTRAACKCKDEFFQKFVYRKIQSMSVSDKHWLVDNTGIPHYLIKATPEVLLKGGHHAEQWAKYYLYFRCRIGSRRQLAYQNHGEARERFKTLMTEFDHWSGN